MDAASGTAGLRYKKLLGDALAARGGVFPGPGGVTTSVVNGNPSLVLHVAAGQTVSATVDASTVFSLGASSGDFTAYGANPSQSGAVRLSNGTNAVGVASRDGAGATDIGLMSLDSGNNLFFNTFGTLNSIQLGQTPTLFWNLLNSCIFGQPNRPTDTAASSLTVRAQSALASAVTFLNGGALILASGDAQANGVTGLRGPVQLNLSHTLSQVGIEVSEVAVGRRVVAVNAFGSGITSTAVPSGDKVLFVGVAGTNPSSTPVGGFVFYCPSGAGFPAYYTSGGFQLSLPNTTASTVGAAGAASALPAQPLGYLSLSINSGTAIKIPYYNP